MAVDQIICASGLRTSEWRSCCSVRKMRQNKKPTPKRLCLQIGQNRFWLGVQVDISHVGGGAVTHRGAFFLVQETKLTHMFSTAHASRTERAK